jgi:hypothetical protein
MANKKITELDLLTDAPAGTDILAIVDDTVGTPTTKRVTVTNLMTQAPVQSVAGQTGTVTLSNTDISGLGTAATANTGTGNGDVLAIGSGALDVGGNAISNFDASINDQTGTTYTIVAGDNGKVVVLDNASAVTVTVPSGLGAGFNCSFVQKGAGQVSFAASSTTINNRQSHTKINAQYGVASIVAYAADTFVLAGDTTS